MNSRCIEIRPAGLRAFVRFPFRLYGRDTHWVPPLIADEMRSLDPAKNPAFAHCQSDYRMAWRDGVPVGRVATFLSRRDNEHRNARILRFGYLDFIDDRAVSGALLQMVQDRARELGMDTIEGPQGAGHFDRNSVLIEGFDTRPTSISPYNFPYYAEHLEAFGLRKKIDYLEHRLRLDPERLPRLGRIAQRVMKGKGLRMWQARTRRELLTRSRELFALINAGYAGLHDFVPLTPEEADFLIAQFFAHADPRFVKIVVDADDRVVACGVAMPSFAEGLHAARGRLWPFGWWHLLRSMRRGDTLELYLVAVLPELRGAGLNAILMVEMQRTANKAGLFLADTTGELETNKRILAMWQAYDSRLIRRRRIYEKAIGERPPN